MYKNEHILKLMTYNIHSGKDLWMRPSFNSIIQYMENTQANVMCIQEINENEKRGYQVSKINNTLQTHCSFAPNVPLGRGYYGTATFTSFSILENHHFLLSSKKEQRGLLHTVLSLGIQRLHVLNTHLGLAKVERNQQFQFIREYISQLHPPVILMGDFNTTTLELQDIPLIDAAQISRQEHIPTFIPMRKRIDYIFVSPSIKVLNYHVAPSCFSDHYPVLIQVSI
ncbi:MAG: endonuclease/exonuclease/phosphatase family protein [Dehalobacterium sp.]